MKHHKIFQNHIRYLVVLIHDFNIIASVFESSAEQCQNNKYKEEIEDTGSLEKSILSSSRLNLQNDSKQHNPPGFTYTIYKM